MINLAIADLMMGEIKISSLIKEKVLLNICFSMIGVYLLIIAVVDLRTVGVYFNYAIDWQHGMEIMFHKKSF
jgi:hypothetical protein